LLAGTFDKFNYAYANTTGKHRYPDTNNNICSFESLFQNKETITEQEWNKIIDSFHAYAQWKSEEEGTCVASLGIERIQTILSSTYQTQIVALLDQDKDLEDIVIFPGTATPDAQQH